VKALIAILLLSNAAADPSASDKAEDKAPASPPDLAVPATGWATRRPHPQVAAMPPNSWLILPTKYHPEGALSFGKNKFGVDYNQFGHPKTEVCLVYDEAENVIVWFGGCSAGYTNQTMLLSVSDAIWYQAQPEHIDSYTGKLRNAKDRPLGQCSYGACYDPDAKLYIKGMGIASGWPYDQKIWAYDTGKNRWHDLAKWQTEGTGKAGCYRIVYDRDAKLVILFGGLPMDNNATWTFDVAKRQWTKVKIDGPSPRGRIYHHMVYDEKRKMTVLFGGAGGKYGKDTTHLNDTWVFDSSRNTWTEMKPERSPSPRDRGAMAYDSVNGVCVLVGGKKGPERNFEDTWVYDLGKNEWREMMPARQPPYFPLYQAAYDRVNNVTVYAGRGRTYLYRYAAPNGESSK
jgi:N-acetylneuraminic acid mutarotase